MQVRKPSIMFTNQFGSTISYNAVFSDRSQKKNPKIQKKILNIKKFQNLKRKLKGIKNSDADDPTKYSRNSAHYLLDFSLLSLEDENSTHQFFSPFQHLVKPFIKLLDLFFSSIYSALDYDNSRLVDRSSSLFFIFIFLWLDFVFWQ